jgi:hypothetical protein
MKTERLSSMVFCLLPAISVLQCPIFQTDRDTAGPHPACAQPPKKKHLWKLQAAFQEESSSSTICLSLCCHLIHISHDTGFALLVALGGNTEPLWVEGEFLGKLILLVVSLPISRYFQTLLMCL